MSRKGSNLQDYGIEEEIDPKLKFNALISVTVSTIMCIAAKCPLPKSNVETTKLFLSTITDDSGKTPRNIKGFLALLNAYSGPYENDSQKEKLFEKPVIEKLIPEKKETSLEDESVSLPKISTSLLLSKEMPPSPDGHSSNKRNAKTHISKKNEKEPHKKVNKHLGSRISPSKSVISSKN